MITREEEMEEMLSSAFSMLMTLFLQTSHLRLGAVTCVELND